MSLLFITLYNAVIIVKHFIRAACPLSREVRHVRNAGNASQSRRWRRIWTCLFYRYWPTLWIPYSNTKCV